MKKIADWAQIYVEEKFKIEQSALNRSLSDDDYDLMLTKFINQYYDDELVKYVEKSNYNRLAIENYSEEDLTRFKSSKKIAGIVFGSKISKSILW